MNIAPANQDYTNDRKSLFETSSDNPRSSTFIAKTGDGSTAVPGLPPNMNALLHNRKVGETARRLVSDIVDEIKAKISTGNVADVDRLLTQAAIALTGDPDADENSEEIRKIKAELRRLIKDLVAPRSVVAANGDLATGKEPDKLPESVLGGYDPKSNTILISSDHVGKDGEAAVKDTVKEEVSEAVVADLSRKTKVSFSGDAGDRLSSVLSGKSAREAIADESPGAVKVQARLNGEIADVAVRNAAKLHFRHDQDAEILPPERLSKYNRVSFRVIAPHKGQENPERVARDITTQAVNWVKGRVGSTNGKSQQIFNNIYDIVYTITDATQGSKPDKGHQLQLELEHKDNQFTIRHLRTSGHSHIVNSYFIFGGDTHDSKFEGTYAHDFGSVFSNTAEAFTWPNFAHDTLQKVFLPQTDDQRNFTRTGNVWQSHIIPTKPWEDSLEAAKQSRRGVNFTLQGPEDQGQVDQEREDGTELVGAGDPAIEKKYKGVKELPQQSDPSKLPQPPQDPPVEPSDSGSDDPIGDGEGPRFDGGSISAGVLPGTGGASGGGVGVEVLPAGEAEEEVGEVATDINGEPAVSLNDFTVTKQSLKKFAVEAELSEKDALKLGEAITRLVAEGAGSGDPDDPDGGFDLFQLFDELKEDGISERILGKYADFITKVNKPNFLKFMEYAASAGHSQAIFDRLKYLGTRFGKGINQLLGQKSEHTFNALAAHEFGGRILFEPEASTDSSLWKNDENAKALNTILNNKTVRSALEQTAAIFEDGSKHKEPFLSKVFGHLDEQQRRGIETFYAELADLVAGDEPVSKAAVNAFLDKNEMLFGIFGGKDFGGEGVDVSGFFDPVLRRIGIASNIAALASQTNFAIAGTLATTVAEEFTHSIASRLNISNETTGAANDVGRAMVNYLYYAKMSGVKQGADRVPTDEEVRNSHGADQSDLFKTQEGNSVFGKLRIGGQLNAKLIVEGREDTTTDILSEAGFPKIYRIAARFEYRLSKVSGEFNFSPAPEKKHNSVKITDGSFKVYGTTAFRAEVPNFVSKLLHLPKDENSPYFIKSKQQRARDYAFLAGFENFKPKYTAFEFISAPLFKLYPFTKERAKYENSKLGKKVTIETVIDTIFNLKAKILLTSPPDKIAYRSFFVAPSVGSRANLNFTLRGVEFGTLLGKKVELESAGDIPLQERYQDYPSTRTDPSMQVSGGSDLDTGESTGPRQSGLLSGEPFQTKFEGKVGVTFSAGAYFGDGPDIDAAD